MQNVSQLPGIAATHSSPDILVVTRTFFPKEGGIEDYVYNRCLQEPDRIVVLSAQAPGDAAFDANQAFDVHRWPVPAFLNASKAGRVIKQLVYMIWALIYSIRLYFRYRYSYLEWYHGYDFPVLLALSYLLPVRTSMVLHGDDLICPLKNPLLKWLFVWTVNRTDAIVCNSQFTCDYLKKFIAVKSPTYVIHPSVRDEKFGANAADPQVIATRRHQIRQRYGIPDASVVIVSVGRLIARKGFDRIIENMPLLLEDGLDVHYLMCGRGPLQPQFKELAARLGVSDRVHFAGFVPDDELASHYCAGDIFCMLTSYEPGVPFWAISVEGFGIVYIEANYFGIPTLACRVGGVVDAVIHEETGLLVNPDVPAETTEALKRLCRDRELRERLGKKGYEFARRKTPYNIIYAAD